MNTHIICISKRVDLCTTQSGTWTRRAMVGSKLGPIFVYPVSLFEDLFLITQWFKEKELHSLKTLVRSSTFVVLKKKQR